MPLVLEHSWFMMQRWLRALLRQPAWIVVTLVQPVIWLLLFGALPGWECCRTTSVGSSTAS